MLAFAFEDWDGAQPVPSTLDALRLDKEFMHLSANAPAAAVTRRQTLKMQPETRLTGGDAGLDANRRSTGLP